MDGAQLRARHTTPEGDVEEDLVIDLRDPVNIEQVIRMRDAMRAQATLDLGEIAGRDVDISLVPVD